ncbi:hypothetical protein FHS61_000254 [Altererythrobacter atlanticus]|uniref:Uncharacterized protein n=1 Tax=Croceibacterium atlanticum TaxID=1267766 RepID=A0A0F7KSD8_9SPHN|nr:hypothetical protein [Croceibacterium atlanticum]AKH42484.1 hypothetical protein WYH_01443 [Croceibacterium atlanticum]MBB5731261.1 hypothetical protein [Croceibacterium atlanticum]
MAISGPHERELAAGLSARPLPGIPLRLAAELRASEGAFHDEIRPAAYVVSEFLPMRLPHGLRAETYFQAGYVGGRYATAFFDGQARIEREFAQWKDFRLGAGSGVWGGAQQGSSRLDIGPAATATFPLGPARARLSAEYRFRVAGDAKPDSGPALTLSAGF